MQRHAQMGRKIKQIRADIASVTDAIIEAYPSANNGFRNHATRQLDRARAALELARCSMEETMMREYPYSYDKQAYQGEAGHE